MQKKRSLAMLAVLLLFLALGWTLLGREEIRGPGDMGMYESYCHTGKFSEIMTGRNGDKQPHYLTVTFTGTSGPLETEVQVLSREPKTQEYTLVESFTAEFGKGRVTVIPAGQEFQIMAKTTEGQQGTGTFQVILAKGEVK